MSHDPPFQLDLTTCDREPIHIPGSIQPHGVLLAFSEPDLTIVQASANTQDLLGYALSSLLGQPLSVLLPPDQIAYLQAEIATQQVDENPLYTLTLTIGDPGQLFDVIAHRISGLIILELERSTQADSAASLRVYRMVKHAVTVCQRTTSVRTFAQALAEVVRLLTGFDRVMVYQFQPDESGLVIAEDCRENLVPYLDLRYPASDIPRQARMLYLRNWLRLIPDVDYVPVPMRGLSADHPSIPLDMSHAALRSVSPIHIEYLQNMGATASMSISL
ncbi:MAG: GAF domain-containing protein, partial [Oscillochloris sp.]|nr:GAF domain-containing protein [Oscillochloris sp.]